MLKKAVIFSWGCVYDILVLPVCIVFIMFSFLFKKLSGYFTARIKGFREAFSIGPATAPCVVFYCSSVGEFEQAEPLMQKMHHAGKRTVIFFHSKKGFDYAQKYAAYETYLCPFDLFVVWRMILKRLKPKQVVISRHEFWPGMILASASCTDLLIVNYIAGNKRSLIHKMARVLSKKIYTVNPVDNGSVKYNYVGDMRTDRLLHRKHEGEEKLNGLRSCVQKHLTPCQKLVVIGNAYAEDLKWLDQLDEDIFCTFKFLVVPARGYVYPELHTISTFTDDHGFDWKNKNVIQVNTVGDLFELYGCASIAWVGGGFGAGIHNCLEPAFYGLPLLSGPNLHSQVDAEHYYREGRLRIFENGEQLAALLELFADQPPVQPIYSQDRSPAEMIYKQLL